MVTETELAYGLAAAGMPIVAVPSAEPAGIKTDLASLVEGLLASGNPLFQACIVPLFMGGHAAPSSICVVADRLASAPRRALAHLYTAAVALRSAWRTRLRLARPDLVELPDMFSRDLGLPSPAGDYGRPCLAEIAARLERGEAGLRIRGADRLIAGLVEQMFAVLLREKPGAAAG